MKDGVNATPLPTVNTTGYIDHAAFLGTINPDNNKIPKHLFQGYLNIYNNYFSGSFVSSRRRHTRLQGDWSSDVCSSDLKRSPGDFAGLVIGGAVVAIIMVIGPITGASLNPARAFGPELVSALKSGATHWNQLLDRKSVV